MVIPVAAALPYTASLLEDVHSGFIKGVLPRTGFAKYVMGKVMACGLSGALTVGLGIVLLDSLCALIIGPMEASGADVLVTRLEIAEQALLFCLFGMLWAQVGMLLCLMTDSRYMAYASALIVCYALHILQQRYFPEAFMLSPQSWLQPVAKGAMGIGGAAIWMTELIAIVSILCFAWGERRVREL